MGDWTRGLVQFMFVRVRWLSRVNMTYGYNLLRVPWRRVFLGSAGRPWRKSDFRAECLKCQRLFYAERQRWAVRVSLD
jgi:hypothetical protein